MYKRALVWGLMMVLATTAFLGAQDWKGKGRLGGIVLDQAGAPLEGVRVKLFSVKAQEGLEVKTDKSGRWMAAWIRSGGWNIDFDKIGYAPKKLSVDISENKKNPDIELIEEVVPWQQLFQQLIQRRGGELDHLVIDHPDRPQRPGER